MKLLITGDPHIMWRQPIARTDDFMETQIHKLSFITDLMKQYDAVWINPGDTFDEARSYYSNELMNFITTHLPDSIGVAGNHDLVDNNITNYNKSMLSIAERLGIFKLLPIDNTPHYLTPSVHVTGFHYGQPFAHTNVEGECNIAVFHGMVVDSMDLRSKEFNAESLLKEYPEYDFIITGHNHKTIVKTVDNRTLINAGSIYRITASQVDFEPRVYIVDTQTKEIIEIKIPIEEGAVVRDHLERGEDKEELLREVTEKLKIGNISSVNFRENAEEALLSSKFDKAVETEVMSCIPRR